MAAGPSGDFTVDNTAPLVTVSTLTTADSTPTLLGTVTGATDVNVTVDGHVYAAAVSGNTWSAEVTDTLADGIYDVSTSSSDPTGNTGTDSSTNELQVAASPPAAPVVTDGPDFTVESLPVQICGTTGTGTVEMRVDGIPFTYSNGDINWCVILHDDGDPDPVQRYELTALNVAGVESVPTVVTVTLDPPSVPLRGSMVAALLLLTAGLVSLRTARRRTA